jgi:ketosteroid isomerase-like protein
MESSGWGRDTALAMSRENVEVVRAAFDTWNAGDMDAWAELLAPDVITRAPEGWPEPGPFVGGEAVVRQFEQQRGALDSDAAEPISDFIGMGDRVVVKFIWRGAGAGPPLNMEISCVYTIRKGRILMMEFFWDHDDALEKAGLSE